MPGCLPYLLDVSRFLKGFGSAFFLRIRIRTRVKSSCGGIRGVKGKNEIKMLNFFSRFRCFWTTQKKKKCKRIYEIFSVPNCLKRMINTKKHTGCPKHADPCGSGSETLIFNHINFDFLEFQLKYFISDSFSLVCKLFFFSILLFFRSRRKRFAWHTYIDTLASKGLTKNIRYVSYITWTSFCVYYKYRTII